MNNQQFNAQFNPNQLGQNNVKLTTILQNFLTNFLNFSGKATRKEFWYPTLTYYTISFVFILLVGLSAAFTISSATSSFDRRDYFGGLDTALDGISTIGSMLGVYLSFAVYSIIFHIGYFSAHVRRLRDAGFSNKGILTIYAAYYILVIFSGFILSLIWSLIMYIVLPLLPSNQLETNNNDGFSTFMFRQNPQAAAYYAQHGNPGFGYNPNLQGQNFNQSPANNTQTTQQGFNQTPANNTQTTQQGFNQTPTNNTQTTQQGFNQTPADNTQTTQQGFNHNPVNNYGFQNPQTPVNSTQIPVQPVVQETPAKKEVNTELPLQEPVKVEVPNVETTKTETPKAEKAQPVNPFGDQVFKK